MIFISSVSCLSINASVFLKKLFVLCINYIVNVLYSWQAFNADVCSEIKGAKSQLEKVARVRPPKS